MHLQVLEELEGEGHCVHECDISDPEQVLHMVNQVSERYGRLDVLVNNAAIYDETPVLRTSYSDWCAAWQRTMATNALGPANLCWCAANLMARGGGGAIVSVSSRGAVRGEPDAPGYGASKAALNSMSQSLAKALGHANIAVSVVAPGFVETEMAARVLQGPRGDLIRQESPFQRVATPDEVAHTVVFLANPESKWLSGAVVDCNGASYVH